MSLPRSFALFALLLAVGCAGLDTKPRNLAPIRATFLDDIGTTTANGVEWEVGLFGVPGDRWSTPTTLKWGVGERTELSATWYVYRWWVDPAAAEQNGTGNGALVLRHRFVDETEDAPALLGRLDLFAPVGNAGARLFDDWGGAGSIALSKHVAGVAWNVNYQLAMFNDPDSSTPDSVHTLGLMASGFLTERWFGFAECSAYLGTELVCNEMFLQAGTGYFVTDSLAVDLSVIAGFAGRDEDCDDFAISSGFTAFF